ncbi:unnamed protein product [Diplocarpon coronariae]
MCVHEENREPVQESSWWRRGTEKEEEEEEEEEELLSRAQGNFWIWIRFGSGWDSDSGVGLYGEPGCGHNAARSMYGRGPWRCAPGLLATVGAIRIEPAQRKRHSCAGEEMGRAEQIRAREKHVPPCHINKCKFQLRWSIDLSTSYRDAAKSVDAPRALRQLPWSRESCFRRHIPITPPSLTSPSLSSCMAVRKGMPGSWRFTFLYLDACLVGRAVQCRIHRRSHPHPRRHRHVAVTSPSRRRHIQLPSLPFHSTCLTPHCWATVMLAQNEHRISTSNPGFQALNASLDAPRLAPAAKHPVRRALATAGDCRRFAKPFTSILSDTPLPTRSLRRLHLRSGIAPQPFARYLSPSFRPLPTDPPTRLLTCLPTHRELRIILPERPLRNPKPAGYRAEEREETSDGEAAEEHRGTQYSHSITRRSRPIRDSDPSSLIAWAHPLGLSTDR